MKCFCCDRNIKDTYNKRRFKKYCISCSRVLEKEENKK